MKKTLLVLTALLFLSACTPTTSSSSSEIAKIPLEYAENGGLMEASGAEIYQMVITEERNIPFVVTLLGCSACATAKEDLDQIAVSIHTIVYFVELNPALEDYSTTYDYIYRATNEGSEYTDQAAWPAIGEDYSTPTLYVMWQKWIGACITDSFSTNLVRYCKVQTA